MCMSMVSMARFPKGLVRFGALIERNRILRLLWGLSACLVFFICDTVPVVSSPSNSYNQTEAAMTEFNTYDPHCHYIVYVTHSVSLVLVAVSSMVNLGHMTKGVLIFLATGLHCLMVLLFIAGPYDYYNKNFNVTRTVCNFINFCSLSFYFYISCVLTNPNSGNHYSHIKYRLLGQMIASAVAMNFFNFQMEFTSRRLYMWKEDSKREKERASDLQRKNEALVYNLLPTHVARDFLGRKKRDSVGNWPTPIIGPFFNQSLNGLECLGFLNEIISDYDELLNLSRFATVVKIKTVGPTYMAASGMVVKETRKDYDMSIQDTWGHLNDLVQFAHALQVVLKKINEQSFNNFILRIGINHGPVIAGVIGARKPHYDIWGNTVNVASRMESTGQSGRIQVVEETKIILEVFGYTFEKRGLIKVKGKGELMTYFLERAIGVDAEDINIPNQVPSLYSSHQTTTSS
ncbi:unnamed protein product [Lymnaea stagnalis]|uniref:adenylate cyclase n=1 Tax=Lymnaea stagnalis TaxID=6523 RepID=A0AAV2IRI6_LYMST